MRNRCRKKHRASLHFSNIVKVPRGTSYPQSSTRQTYLPSKSKTDFTVHISKTAQRYWRKNPFFDERNVDAILLVVFFKQLTSDKVEVTFDPKEGLQKVAPAPPLPLPRKVNLTRNASLPPPLKRQASTSPHPPLPFLCRHVIYREFRHTENSMSSAAP